MISSLCQPAEIHTYLRYSCGLYIACLLAAGLCLNTLYYGPLWQTIIKEIDNVSSLILSTFLFYFICIPHFFHSCLTLNWSVIHTNLLLKEKITTKNDNNNNNKKKINISIHMVEIHQNTSAYYKYFCWASYFHLGAQLKHHMHV